MKLHRAWILWFSLAAAAAAQTGGVATPVHSGPNLPSGAGPNQAFVLTSTSPESLWVCETRPQCLQPADWAEIGPITPQGPDYSVQYSLSSQLAGGNSFSYNPNTETLTVGTPNGGAGTQLGADPSGYLETSLIPPSSDSSARLATTNNVHTTPSNWLNMINQPLLFPPTLPTASAPGGVFLPVNCPVGQHIYGLASNGQLLCSNDLAPSITLEANGVVIGTGLNTFNFVASAGLNITATANQTTGVVTFTITGSTATQAQSPVFNPLPGFYAPGQTVTLTCASPSPTIYYTTNGTTPTHASASYSTPIAVSNTTLEALCASSGLSDSNVQTGIYTVSTPGVSLVPATLDFGSQLVGVPAYQPVTLTNNGNATLTISSFTPTGDYLETNNCSGSLTAGNQCTINVQFTPSVTGTRTGTISIADNASGSPQTISLTGTGVLPTAALSPSSLAFGNQTDNTTSAAQAVTVTNNSSVPLTVTSVSIAGANASQFAQSNNCITVAGGGGTCTINVTFSPTATGAASASLTIADNAANSPQTAALTGTGTAPPIPVIGFSASTLSFGTQKVGTSSASQALTVTNSGTSNLNVSVALAGNNASDFSQTNNCSVVVPNGTCTVHVTYSPIGAHASSAQVKFTDNAVGSPQSVNLTGTGANSSATLAPSSVAFGNQTVGTSSATHTLTVTNTSSVTLNISSITLSGEFSQTNNCSSTLGSGNSCTITATFSPTVPGATAQTLSVNDDAPGSPQNASLTGTGTQPSASFSPTTGSGSCINGVCTFAPSSGFVLTNNGPGTLLISSTQVVVTSGSPAFSVISNTCGSSLGSGSSCTIKLNFSGGNGQAQLEVTDNASNSPQTVSLTGVTTVH